MSTLREKLEAKERRRVVVPIQVSDPSADHETWMGIYAAMQAALGREDTAAATQLKNDMDAVTERLRSHWVNVEFQALSSADWEVASREWASQDENAAGGIDWPKALAPLLGQSATDTELDDTWWEEQLRRPSWSEGDKDALKLALLRLNVSAVEPHIPKD